MSEQNRVITSTSLKGNVVTRTSDGIPLSFTYDDTWNFVGEKNVGAHSEEFVSFTRAPGGAKRKFIQETVELLVNQQKNASVRLYSSLADRWITLACHTNFQSWSVIIDNEAEWKHLKRQLSNKYSISYVEHLATAINKLRKLGLTNRVVTYKEFRELARKNSETKQHIGLPNRIYIEIAKNAIADTEKYYDLRHQISEIMQHALNTTDYFRSGQYKDKGDYKGSDSQQYRNNLANKALKEIQHDIPNFQIKLPATPLYRIQATCLIVNSFFSGVRIGEGLDLNPNSYRTKTVEGRMISYIQGFTTKGNKGEKKSAVWQAHPLVKKSLELSFDATQYVRKLFQNKLKEDLQKGTINKDIYDRKFSITNSAFLKSTKDSLKPLPAKLLLDNPSGLINKYIQALNIEVTNEDVEEFNTLNPSRVGEMEVGKPLPTLTNHDLRRSFAVFIKRHNFGNGSTLKYQLQHLNLYMSEYYANNADLLRMEETVMDQELIDLLEEEGIKLGVDVFDEIYNKSLNLSGIEGERILKDKFEKLKAGHKVYMSRRDIEDNLRNGNLSIVLLPSGGYCTNSNCERLCSIDNFIAEKTPCPTEVNTDKSAKQFAKQRNRLIYRFREMNTGEEFMNHILSGFKQKILKLELILQKHQISYEPFQDKIKGCYE